jgi:hypothetical protein
MVNVLYIHGMGGGGDSRIPSILAEELSAYGVDVVVRTYDFDPEKAHAQIASWMEELAPSMVIGESLGALHALRLNGVHRLFVSPAVNAPIYFGLMSWLVWIPGVARLFDHIYMPKEGDRQQIHFTFKVLRKYLTHRKEALRLSAQREVNTFFHAFFGTDDHYMDSGIVSVKTWRKYFGYSYSLYEGTHFMEEEYVRTLLADTVLDVLDINK